MKEKDFVKSIRKSFELLNSMELCDWSDFPNPTSLNVSDEFKKVALDPGSAYEDIFKAALRLNHFNFVLVDLSMFQLSRRIEDGNEIYRYSFLPNPFGVSAAEISDSFETLLHGAEIVDQVFDEAEIIIDRPPIRFDFDVKGYRPPGHPAGHFHIGGYNNNRWPVDKLLTPEVFVCVVAKHYFLDHWNIGIKSEPTDSGFFNYFDEQFANLKKECLDLRDEFFDSNEQKLFHFT